ncbi:sulfonate ABC transporter ATP-binding protein [Prauserella marina]|uniref:Sulfonate transport system ATP-binding protein n=1 Tax=Prauserella marina TaxID=530584 RepID=A0A222VR31_9PSEU|nr:ABC transporter ATP-binding protein [Prauserella marina]ASR36377.1 sulfonate ABC transporter ATP-binding protein [Prauserella marina]PWV77177.1 sulfonate transport system ATP-binding protein [Prauserella marina]SDD06187.1 sulfonate transport system ATP-binding protein [Prauserella marina]
MSASAVHTEGLTRSYGGRVVLDDVDLRIAPGEFVALIGRSGSGKSTLLRALAQLDDYVDGSGTVSVPDNRSVLFQDSRLLPWDRVLDNVTIGLPGPEAKARGKAALADVGLAGRERAWPNALSGGEQQRVALARSLVREPDLLLADEPFGALDALTRLRMHALLLDLVAAHRPAVLLVTHDVDEALALADRVLVLEAGRVVLDHAVGLPRPRRHGAPELAGAREELLRGLGVDVSPGERPVTA